MTNFTDPLVPLPEAAAALGISMPTAYKRIERRGQLHPLLPTLMRDHPGKYARTYVRRSELENLLGEVEQ